MLFTLPNVCMLHFYDLSALVGFWFSVSITRSIICTFLNASPFGYTAFGLVGRLGTRKPV